MPQGRRTQPSGSEIARMKKQIRKPGSQLHAKVCVYGPNGSGKTRLAASGPKTLLLTFPGEEDRSIKGWPGVRVIEAHQWPLVGTVYWYLKGGNHPFETVSIDTVTGMNGLALDFVLGEAEDRDPTRERAQPDKRTWGRAGQLMRGMLLAYKNLPMNVVFTAQERRIRDPDTEELLEVTVDLPNSSRGVALGSVGVLGRMVPKEVKVRGGEKTRRVWRDHLYLAPSDIIRTKEQTNLLGNVLVRPTMDKIIEAWVTNPPKEGE